MIDQELLQAAAKECQDKVALLPALAELQSLPEDQCPVAWAKDVIELAYANNCGKSVPCRDGLWQSRAVVEAIVSGSGTGEDVTLLADIVNYLDQIGCAFVRQAAQLVKASMSQYAEEWDRHARMKRCAALQCPAYYAVYIDPSLCIGCGACIKAAPAGAIEGAPGKISMVRDDAALKGDFAKVCPKGAIRRYSPSGIKPKTPDELTDCGAFDAAGGRRRRRG